MTRWTGVKKSSIPEHPNSSTLSFAPSTLSIPRAPSCPLPKSLSAVQLAVLPSFSLSLSSPCLLHLARSPVCSVHAFSPSLCYTPFANSFALCPSLALLLSRSPTLPLTKRSVFPHLTFSVSSSVTALLYLALSLSPYFSLSLTLSLSLSHPLGRSPCTLTFLAHSDVPSLYGSLHPSPSPLYPHLLPCYAPTKCLSLSIPSRSPLPSLSA